MRMLFLTLLVFVLAGVSIGLSRLGLREYVPQLFSRLSPELTFEVAPETLEPDTVVTIARARPDGVMLLTSANRAQTARFQMPQDVALTTGVLNLKATAQIGDDQHNLLRILVGNQIRGEVLLRPGQYDIDTEVELTADDLASDALAIRYVLVTPEDDGACVIDDAWSNVLEIEQDSRLILNVPDPDLSPRDQVASWGNVVLIGWPDWLSEDARRDRWMSAAALVARGFDVRFVDAPNSETMSGEALAAFVASDVPALVLEDDMPAWPEYIAEVGANAGKRTFQRNASWRHWYRVGPHGHLSAPGAFDYELMLSTLPAGANWTVTVTHNGTIVDAQEVAGNIGAVRGVIDLRDTEILDANVVEVTAISGYEPTGLCNNGPSLFGELRPETKLLPGGAPFIDTLEDVRINLNQRQPVTVGFLDKMSLVEAQRMLDLTAEVITADTELRLETIENTALTAVRRGDIEDVLETLPATAFVVWLDDSKRPMAARPDDFAADPLLSPKGALTLVITPNPAYRTTELIPQ